MQTKKGGLVNNRPPFLRLLLISGKRSQPQLRQTNDQPEQPWVVLRMPSPNDGARGWTATFEGHGNTRSHPS